MSSEYKEYTVRHFLNGDKMYLQDGVIHREDGPAVESKNGYKDYRIHGEYHREDGPAVYYTMGEKHYYLEDVRVTKEEHEKLTKKFKTINGHVFEYKLVRKEDNES